MLTSDEKRGADFKMGPISRLTGLSTHTLRKREARCVAIAPRCIERGDRCCTREDVERLYLVKRLVGSGMASSDAARLNDPDLEQKSGHLAKIDSASSSSHRRAISAAVLDCTVAALFEHQSAGENAVEAASSASSVAETSPTFDASPIVGFVYDRPIVEQGMRRPIESLPTRKDAAAAVIVFGPSTREVLVTVRSPRFPTFRAAQARAVFEDAMERAAEVEGTSSTNSRNWGAQ